MRNLIAIVLVGLLMFLAGCPKPPVDPPPVSDKGVVTITTNEGFNTTVLMGSLFKKASMVVGFEHQYDTCYLTVTNQGAPSGANQDTYKNPIEPIFSPVSLSKGLYSFYVDTSPDPLIVQFKKSFIAYSQPDSVRAGATYELALDEEVKQALVLVDANTVDGTPTITVGLTTVPMQRYLDFWYAYTLSPAAITAIIGGNEIIKGTPFNQGDIYVWIAVEGTITTNDGHTNLYYL